MNKFNLPLLFLTGTLALGACSDSNAPHIESDHYALESTDQVIAHTAHISEVSEVHLPNAHVTEYVKPGAAVSFSNDYDGQSDPGIRDSFSLSVKPAYRAGSLALRFSATEGLDLLMDSEIRVDMSGEQIDVPIEFYADQPGEYRFNVFAKVASDSILGLARAYTVTLSVGDSSQTLIRKSEVQTLDAAGEAVIVRSARETIR